MVLESWLLTCRRMRPDPSQKSTARGSTSQGKTQTPRRKALR